LAPWPCGTSAGPFRRTVIPAGTNTIILKTPNEVVKCSELRGMVSIRAANVAIVNSTVDTLHGNKANGSASITVEDGASATISHVTINGGKTVHACIFHDGTSQSLQRPPGGPAQLG
jgi:hypothetical protein